MNVASTAASSDPAPEGVKKAWAVDGEGVTRMPVKTVEMIPSTSYHCSPSHSTPPPAPRDSGTTWPDL